MSQPTLQTPPPHYPSVSIPLDLYGGPDRISNLHLLRVKQESLMFPPPHSFQTTYRVAKPQRVFDTNLTLTSSRGGSMRTELFSGASKNDENHQDKNGPSFR